MKNEIAHVSYSELKNWHRCPFYHKLTYIDKIRLFRGNEYTAFGNAIHDTCESILLNENVEAAEYFMKQYKKALKKLAADDFNFNKKLAVDMKKQGKDMLPEIKPALKKQFGEYKVFSTEEPLMEKVNDFTEKEYNFKGYIDLVIQTSDNKYKIIDWKTCSWGWDSRKKTDKLILYQLVFYKYYFSQKHNIPEDDIDIYFGLLKRTAKNNKVEFVNVTSGKKRIQNAVNFLYEALYNINNKKYIKNRLSCGTCEFKQTEYCP
mgnify:CR=1 FL=1